MINLDILQPLLEVGKSNPFFEILFDPNVSDELLVHSGMKLLEKVSRSSFPEKLLIIHDHLIYEEKYIGTVGIYRYKFVTKIATLQNKIIKSILLLPIYWARGEG